jgi:hypothetical protein
MQNPATGHAFLPTRDPSAAGLSSFVGAAALLVILRNVTGLAGGRVVGASPLLLLAAQEVPAQLGGEPGILVGAANDTVMAGAGLGRVRGLGTLIGHR